MLWLIPLFVFVFIILTYLWLRLLVTRNIPKTYPNPQNQQTLHLSKKSIICLGDSNTHGNVSYDWVNDLSKQLPDYQIFNAGINSDLTYTILNRLDDIIAYNPDYISILIGTNDVNSTINRIIERRYQQIGRITKDTIPDFNSFKANYIKIIHRLKQETKARIALMSLPLMGEDLNHQANLKADKYSEFVKELAEHEQLHYLPVREQQKEILLNNPQTLQHSFEETYKLLNFSVVYHYIFSKTWDEISKKHGFQLTPDNLHQNSIGGGIIRDLVKSFIMHVS